MRKLTEYEIARVKNDIFIYLWRGLYQMYLQRVGDDLPANNYEETKRAFDSYERVFVGYDAMIMKTMNAVADSLKDATMDDSGTWRDMYNYLVEMLAPHLTLDEDTE